MSISEVMQIASVPKSGGPNLADWLTAIGTVGLALVTVVTLIVTVRIASTDRRHDDQVRGQDRDEANRLLLEERQAADERLRAEREHAENVRRRERQVDSAMRLLERIAYIMPLIGDLPYRSALSPARQAECNDAVRNLGSGKHTDAVAVGNETLAQQFSNVVGFVDAAWIAKWAKEPSGDDLEFVAAQVRRYALFVQLSLQRFITRGEALDTRKPYYPTLVRKPGDESLWHPDPEPDEWDVALSHDPHDPWYVAPG